MGTLERRSATVPTGWYGAEDCTLAEFREVVEETTRLAGQASGYARWALWISSVGIVVAAIDLLRG